ncbi:hypothetical protein SERLA73DRAFT_175628, partial [Serpula lacrymans var. lacrymans S7.3]
MILIDKCSSCSPSVPIRKTEDPYVLKCSGSTAGGELVTSSPWSSVEHGGFHLASRCTQFSGI